MLIVNSILAKLSWIDNIVSYVWIFLSLLMFSSLSLLYAKSGLSRDSLLVIFLLIATWTYPVYTLGFKLVPGLVGNLFYAVLLLYVIIRVYPKLPTAAWLLMPIGVWITIATVYVIAQVIDQYAQSGQQ
jgi:tryptophan-rich sensory protein